MIADGQAADLPDEHVFARVIHAHIDLEASRDAGTESLVNEVELAIIRALNASVPLERVDEFRRHAGTLTPTRLWGDPHSVGTPKGDPKQPTPKENHVRRPQLGEEVQQVPYDFPLRPDLLIRINLPIDLSTVEAERIATFVRTLAFEQGEPA